MTDLDLISNIINARDNTIKEQTAVAKQYKKEISMKDKVIDEKNAEIDKLKAQLEEMQERLGDSEKLLDKSESHNIMVDKINKQKLFTRKALALVADITRD